MVCDFSKTFTARSVNGTCIKIGAVLYKAFLILASIFGQGRECATAFDIGDHMILRQFDCV